MSRKLDILVPHYNEPAELVIPLLDSIKMQRSVDLNQVGVIIAFDGPDATELPLDEWRAHYPFAIEDVHIPKSGVSAARNAALRASEAEVITYVDFDDCYLDNRAFYILFREMDAEPNPVELAQFGITAEDAGKGFDFLVSVFCEESKDPNTGEVVYLNHDLTDAVFVHGRVARRQWLLDNDLFFDDNVHVHEDSRWVQACRAVAKPWRTKACLHPFALWCFNPNSTCRRDPLYLQKTFNELVASSDSLVDYFLRRGMETEAKQHAAALIFEAFYTLNKESWMTCSKSYRDAVEERVAQYYYKHESMWRSLTEQEKAIISTGVRQRSVMDGMLMEALTCDQWLKRITEKYPPTTT